MNPEDIGVYYESLLDKEVRKEGGVYYTPPFIVDYMVENALSEYMKDKTPVEAAKIKNVDPSCGAGVFLLGVYQYLLDWHKKHIGKLTLEKRRKILTDNIFGVDIDPLAVEITKYCLSMTCSEGKDFTLDLDENIRCGNSLLDSDFCWQKEFSHVFQQGGFDIVIGNPPYVEAKKLKAVAAKLRRDYTVYSGTADLSVYFIERGLQLCKKNGLLLLITTNKFFNTEYGKLVRSFLLKRQIRLMLNFEQVAVFSNSLVSTVILGVNNAPVTSDTFRYQKFYRLNRKEVQSLFPDAIKTQGTYQQSLLGKGEWSFADTRELALKKKIESAGKRIEKIECISVFRGVTTGYNPAFIIDQQKKQELIQQDGKNKKLIKPLLQGRNIRRWVYNASDKFLLQTGYKLDVKNRYPKIFKHLNAFKKNLVKRDDQGVHWWNLRACQYYSHFEQEKIVWGLTADKWAFAYDADGHYLPSNAYLLTSGRVPIKYLLGILNSRLLRYYFGFIGIMTAGGAYTLKHSTIQQLPIVVAKNPQPIITLVDEILSLSGKGADVSDLERQIDALVYELYGLTDEEIALVEG